MHPWLLPFLFCFHWTWPCCGVTRVSAKQNLLASCSPTLFGWSGWKLMWWWSNSRWTSGDFLGVRFIQTKEITAVLQTALKENFNVGMLSNVCEWIWFKLGVMIDTIILYIFMLVLLTLISIQGHRSVRMQNLQRQQSQSIWMKFGILLRHVGVVSLRLILSFPFNIQGREPYLYDFVKNKQTNKQTKNKTKQNKQTNKKPKHFNVGLYSDIYRWVSFKLSMMIKTTRLFRSISVWMTMTVIQGHSCKRNKKKTWMSIFSQI